ncbi:hypothetical protein CCACVL1_23560 [Corchorus capsularis]|uniref:Uncharacterized protein n=1 Tax=Corchorus capsularis TaxID=210143 RepID=A0A1R3GTD5_COCAP|nr:hypothetical protein CCACVL1_23560 [Corchorus capsularis]
MSTSSAINSIEKDITARVWGASAQNESIAHDRPPRALALRVRGRTGEEYGSGPAFFKMVRWEDGARSSRWGSWSAMRFIDGKVAG